MKKPKPRNPYAVVARKKKGGVHSSPKDVTGKRGGSRNEAHELLEEYELEEEEGPEDEEV